MKTRSKTKKLQSFNLEKWLSEMVLSDEDFVKEFQKIALSGNYDSTRKLLPFLNQEIYFQDGGVRAREVLDAGQDDVFMLLAKLPGYNKHNPRRKYLEIAICGTTLFIIAIVWYISVVVE